MIRVPVESSNINTIGYDPKGQLLEVEFKNGQVYEYRDVPPDVCGELLGSPSVGKFFSRHIRNIYPFRRREARDGIQEA